MRDISGKYPYYELFVQNGVLYCAPFGSQSINDVKLAFSQFNQPNEDKFGWWHASCSYSFQKITRASLFNTKVNTEQSLPLKDSSNFFPQDSLQASFGLSTVSSPSKPINGLLIKEVRYWSTQRTSEQIAQHRFSQIDPTIPSLAGNLLSYFSLASGDYNIENLAEMIPGKDLRQTSIQVNNVTWAQEYF